MLADLILYLHFAFVSFVILGTLCIVLGKPLRWGWTRNLRFRLAHLAAIVFVAAEALLGIACPLTVWEDRLRGTSTDETGFIAHRLREILYFDWPAWVFTVLYLAFAVLVALLYRWSPPRGAAAH